MPSLPSLLPTHTGTPGLGFSIERVGEAKLMADTLHLQLKLASSLLEHAASEQEQAGAEGGGGKEGGGGGGGGAGGLVVSKEVMGLVKEKARTAKADADLLALVAEQLSIPTVGGSRPGSPKRPLSPVMSP